MNYKKIHDELIKYCRETSPKDRLLKRNKNDCRKNDLRMYVEIHHIKPSSLGGTNHPSNLVELLPEEHVFIHMLRYKIYQSREDILAVRFMLNGFSSRAKFKLTKKVRMGYAWVRTYAQGVRNSVGWQTPDGRQRISSARKGKMPCKNLATGEKVGMVSLDHPKVKSGEWVHHSKGRIQSKKEILWKRKHNAGQNNPNASGLSDEYFIQKASEYKSRLSRIPTWAEMLRFSETDGFHWIKSLKSRFGGRGKAGYKQIMNSI